MQAQPNRAQQASSPLPTGHSILYLVRAAEQNDCALLNCLLDEDVNLFDCRIWRTRDPPLQSGPRPDHPIWVATVKGHVDILETLLERGGMGAQLNKWEYSRLVWRATCSNQTNVVRMFLARGVDPWQGGGSRHLSESVRNGNVELFTLLLSDYSERSTQPPIKEWRDAYLALQYVKNNEDFTKLLIAAGIDVNRAEPRLSGGQKWRPLYYCGHPGPARLLLGAGANPNIDEDDKWGPLACVVGKFMPEVNPELSSEEQRNRRKEMIELLFDYGADPVRAGGGWAIHGALRDCDFKLAKLLAEKGAKVNVPELTESDQRLLHEAVERCEWGTVMRLTPPNWSIIGYAGPGLINNGRFVSEYSLLVRGQRALLPWLKDENGTMVEGEVPPFATLCLR